MAKGRKSRARKRENVTVARFVRPTEAREAHNDFRSAGAAVRVVPVIESLLKAGRLSQRQFDALAYYREQAHRAEDDAVQESPLSPQRIMGGVSSSPCGGRIPAVLLATPAIVECARLERDLGSLRPIARAIAVDDETLTAWAIRTSGGREHVEKGRIVIRPRNRKAVEMAEMELKFAAARIMR